MRFKHHKAETDVLEISRGSRVVEDPPTDAVTHTPVMAVRTCFPRYIAYANCLQIYARYCCRKCFILQNILVNLRYLYTS